VNDYLIHTIIFVSELFEDKFEELKNNIKKEIKTEINSLAETKSNCIFELIVR
jgi:hypothetical protein